MTKIDNRTKGAALDDLTASANEGDPDNRQGKEEVVLATVAMLGISNPDLWNAFKRLDLACWRAHFHAIAEAVEQCFAEGVPLHQETVQAKLPAGLPEDIRRNALAVLPGILDGSKAVPDAVAIQLANTLAALDRIRGLKSFVWKATHSIDEAEKNVQEGKADLAAVEVIYKQLADGFLDTGINRGLAACPPLAGELIDGFRDNLQKCRKAISGTLDYGFQPLNDILSRAGPGLYVFGGITSCGKTSLMNQIADHVAGVDKVPVLFFAYEQGSEELLVKSLARRSVEETSEDSDKGDNAYIDTEAIQNPRELTDDKMEALDFLMRDYKSGPNAPGRFLRIIDAGDDWTVDKIRLLAIMEKRREERRRIETGTADSLAGKPSCLLILDYLQQIPAVSRVSGREFQSIRERIDFILGALRRLSRELKAPIIVLTSLNRAGYDTKECKDNNGRLVRPPNLAIFKESGGIEYSADAAFCMMEDEKASDEDLMKGRNPDRKTNPEQRRVILFNMKTRNGPRNVHLQADFLPGYAFFRNVMKATGMKG